MKKFSALTAYSAIALGVLLAIVVDKERALE